MKTLHAIAHIFGWNHGKIYSELRGFSVWIGFQCSGCGEISGLHCADGAIDKELQSNRPHENT